MSFSSGHVADKVIRNSENLTKIAPHSMIAAYNRNLGVWSTQVSLGSCGENDGGNEILSS